MDSKADELACELSYIDVKISDTERELSPKELAEEELNASASDDENPSLEKSPPGTPYVASLFKRLSNRM